jgi:hypothetical protein
VQSFFYSADGRRFNDIKQPEEKKTQTKSQKAQREPQEGYEETHHLVDHYRSGVAIFKEYFRSACNPGGKATKMTAVTVCTIVVVRWVIITIGMAANVPQVPGILGRKPVKHPVARKTTMSFLRVEFMDGILKPIMKIDLAFQS